MKLLFVIWAVLSFSSVQARELSAIEKVAIWAVDTANSVTEFMSSNIDTEELSKKEYVLFQTLKRGCYPINKELDAIAQANDGERIHRIKYLSAYTKACKESALSLTNLYIKQHN